MTTPDQKPGRSIQDVQTPPEFLAAVVRRFGPVQVDLAATIENRVALMHCGPGSGFAVDALAISWAAMGFLTGLRWLNPPFANIAAWAAKCAAEREHIPIAMLVPAAVGSNWFNKYVRPYAYVLELTPRLTFVGHKSAYPKDLILAYYSPQGFIGRDTWRWLPPVAKEKAPANDNAVDPRQMPLPIVEAATG